MPKYISKKETPKKKPCCLSKEIPNATDLTFTGCCMGCTKPTKGTEMYINKKRSCTCLNHTKFCKQCLERWLNEESNKRKCPICDEEGISEIKCLETNKIFKILKPLVDDVGHHAIFNVIQALSRGNFILRNTRRNQRLIVGDMGNFNNNRRRIVNDLLDIIDDESHMMVVRFRNHRAIVLRRRVFR